MFVKPHSWVIVDDVESPDRAPAHQIDLGFQFAPMAVSVVRDRWARAMTPAGNTCWIGSFAPAPSAVAQHHAPDAALWEQAMVPSVEPLFDDHDLPIGLALDDLRESVFVDESDIFRSRDL